MDNEGQPYTEVSLVGINFERMKRQVYCEYCKYFIETNLPGAKCGICHAPLITATRITLQNNELA